MFRDPKRQDFTLENHHYIFNEYLFPSDQFQHSTNYLPTLTEEKIDDEKVLSSALVVDLENAKKP